MTRTPRLALALASCSCLVACAGLELTEVTHTAEKPSNVALYFRVQNKDGTPVPGLQAENFRVLEDDAQGSEYESVHIIHNPEIAATHYTLLLVDLSASITESEDFEKIAEASDVFASRVESNNVVGIYGFDGSKEIFEIAPFAKTAEGASRGERVRGAKTNDPSTNLHGAVIAGLARLDEALKDATTPIHVGTLVVFTDGTDRAAWVSAEDMKKAISGSEHDVFAIGLGAEISEDELKTIGKSGYAMASDREKVVEAFDEIATRIEGQTKSYYLLSYCSPARNGTHTVTIEATAEVPDKRGKKSKKLEGKLSTEFDATGFEPKCDPNTPPRFDVTRGDAAADGKGAKAGKGGAKSSGSAEGGGGSADAKGKVSAGGKK